MSKGVLKTVDSLGVVVVVAVVSSAKEYTNDLRNTEGGGGEERD